MEPRTQHIMESCTAERRVKPPAAAGDKIYSTTGCCTLHHQQDKCAGKHNSVEWCLPHQRAPLSQQPWQKAMTLVTYELNSHLRDLRDCAGLQHHQATPQGSEIVTRRHVRHNTSGIAHQGRAGGTRLRVNHSRGFPRQPRLPPKKIKRSPPPPAPCHPLPPPLPSPPLCLPL